MGARKGEANFIAVRLGFWNDPLVLGLARELRVSTGEAGSYWLRWEEFVLSVGDARSGRVKGYTLDHLAVVVGWRGKVRTLADAFKRAGLLKVHRSTLVFPDWTETKSGYYAGLRWDDAERQRLNREHGRGEHAGRLVDGCPACSKAAGQSGERPGTEAGQNADGSRMFGRNGVSASTDTPPSPPQGGDSKGSARWIWLKEHAPNPQNETACREKLDSMSDEDWAATQSAYERYYQPWGPHDGRKKRALEWPTDKFLARGAFEQFRPRKRAKPVRVNGAAKMVEAKPPEPTQEEIERGIVLGKLVSHVVSAEAKRKAIEEFNAKYPGNPIPPPPPTEVH